MAMVGLRRLSDDVTLSMSRGSFTRRHAAASRLSRSLRGMKANVVSYNAIIDGVHAMGPHRLLATSGCDIGIEFLIVIVMVSFVFECCMFGASAPLSIWLLLDVCRRSLRSRSQATLKVAGDAQGRKRRVERCRA